VFGAGGICTEAKAHVGATTASAHGTTASAAAGGSG